MTKNWGKQRCPNHCVLRRQTALEKKKHQKEGRAFSKNDAPLQRQGPFINLGELGTGRAFGLECCASTCKHSHGCFRCLYEAGSSQELARTPPRTSLMWPYSPLFVRRVKTFEYSPLFGNGLAKTFKYTLLFWNREQKTFEYSPFVYNVIAEAFEYSLLCL